MFKTKRETTSICVCGAWTEYKLVEALNIEQKNYSQSCLSLFNSIGRIHIRGIGIFRGLHFLAQMSRYEAA